MSTQLPAVTVVGSINLDIIATTDRLPTAGETVGGGVLQQQPGGKGANQAVAAARLGGSSRMIGAVGDDAQGRLMLEALSGAGVDTSDVAVLDGDATGTALIVVDREGENQIVVCPGANGAFSLEGVEFGPDEVVLCQLEVGLPVALEAARKSSGFFVLNAAPAMNLPSELLERCDLVIVNETEFELIPALAEAKLVAVTYGKVGSAMFEHGRKVAQAPAASVAVANTIGAGDAFCAALVLALRSDLDYTRSLAVANAVGADAVGDPSSQPHLAQLHHYLERTAPDPDAR
ncbi:ribokinase [Arthrobacter globiformis NBRC 12137]|uniref:Ribokinase n=1 Tax=Arthrobacter globiformis (strain ATCC 8010 / DSM 20124 / JCM 1332 / NBRC 12137 / NCIMB 8907 / NRRL B-2979 / 168) TaxID=1077972 RepID=H0QTP5_ARTG1|nr:ribokinase [Arthrobacter globiformis]GAB16196.1 ribokinase [Arthrobacter globiformis NBRC 12137]